MGTAQVKREFTNCPSAVCTQAAPVAGAGARGRESDAALRRVAVSGQGWFSWNRLPDADLTERLVRLDEELAAQGRSRSDDDFELTICPYFNRITPEMVEQYAAAGVDRLLAMCMAFGPDDLQSTLDDLAASLLAPMGLTHEIRRRNAATTSAAVRPAGVIGSGGRQGGRAAVRRGRRSPG